MLLHMEVVCFNQENMEIFVLIIKLSENYILETLKDTNSIL